VLAWQAGHLPPGMAKLATLARHKSWGLTILGLTVLRLAWHWSNRQSPALPATLRPHERVLARLSHRGLYALLLFLMPLSGWLMSSARNFPVSWFGALQLPDLIGPDVEAYEFLRAAHGMLAALLFGLVLLHALAALTHHFVRKDDVLRRMLPFRRRTVARPP
jgi:cytochrome b561